MILLNLLYLNKESYNLYCHLRKVLGLYDSDFTPVAHF